MNWEANVLLESGQFTKIKVSGYNTRQDAENAILSQSGGKRIFGAAYRIGDDIVVNMDGGVGGSWYKEDAVDVPFESSPDNDEFAEMDIEDGQIELDEMEIEMYGMLCERALLNNEELPSIEDFYQWLDNGQF